MPKFQCLGKRFELSHADLARVPGSVLAEAWNTSSGKTVVCLDTWPEPDLDVLEVHNPAGWAICTRPHPATERRVLLTPCCTQGVLNLTKQKPAAPGKILEVPRVMRALAYFAIPYHLWPVGLQMIHQKEQSLQPWLTKDQQALLVLQQALLEAAQSKVDQISTLLRDIALDTYPRPSDSEEGALSLGHCYMADSKECEGRYCIKWCSEYTYGAESDLPATLKAAVNQAGKMQHLALSFSTVNKFTKGTVSTKYRISIQVLHAECVF